MCANVGVHAYVFVCVSACAHDVFVYNNNISPKLIMIIIKIIILYFLQIRHTDDFPLNGYSASQENQQLIEM